MKKQLAILIVTLIPILLISATHTVNLDGSGDFTDIQQAIDSSSDGDIVLVYPGFYAVNLNFNGRSIKLYSMEALTGEDHYIAETILNGCGVGKVIEIWDQQVNNAEIRGFTITNGYGEDRVVGGGISIKAYGDMKITNCEIYDNRVVLAGGGIFISGEVDIELAGLDIHDNFAWKGGGVEYEPEINSEIIFSSVNRCSIYNNLAYSGMDINCYAIPRDYNTVTMIYLDKFSEAVASRYYANYWSFYSSNTGNPMQFDILRGHITPVNSDLYISMDGDDANSGLSPDDPKYSIVDACRLIAADSLNPKTVHIAAGDYSLQFLDRFNTPVLKSHCRLAGAGSDVTYLGGYLENARIIYAMYEYQYIEISGLTIENPVGKGISFHGFSGKKIKFNDVVIKNCNADDFSALYLIHCKRVELRNMKILSCTATHRSSGIYMNDVGLAIIDSCEFTGNQVTENHVECYDNAVRVMADSVIVSNSIFNGNTSYAPGNVNAYNFVGDSLAIFENNLVINNMSYNAQPIGYVRSAKGTSIVRNNTFVNNYISFQDQLVQFAVRGGDAQIYNNIFYNPYSMYDSSELIVYLSNPNDAAVLYNNLIRGGESSVVCIQEDFADLIVFEDTNIDVLPEFVGGDSTSAEYYYLTETSPCVDAGSVTGSNFPLLDLAGNTRTYGSTVDMGCYEWQPVGNFNQDLDFRDTKVIAYNYPNPFNPTTTISYSLPEEGNVCIEVYNIKGQKVKQLINEHKESGHHTIKWNGTDENNKNVGSGVYFYKIKTKKSSLINKMIMLK